MLKAILALTLCAVASSQLNDGWTPASISEVSGIALWSTNQLSTLAGFEGDYTIRTPKNVKKHIVQDGTNYKFQLDVVYRDQNGKYSVTIHYLLNHLVYFINKFQLYFSLRPAICSSSIL